MPGSTPIVGMTALRPDVTRTGADHVFPSAEREMTTSFAAQPVRKRQSCQAVSTDPLRSTSAAISGGARNGRASRGVSSRDRRPGSSSVTPPSVEVDRDHPGAARPEREHEPPVRLDDGDHSGHGQLLRHRRPTRCGRRRRSAAPRAGRRGPEQRVREVAAAAERARRAVVAGEPVLVVGEVVRLRDAPRRSGRST